MSITRQPIANGSTYQVDAIKLDTGVQQPIHQVGGPDGTPLVPLQDGVGPVGVTNPGTAAQGWLGGIFDALTQPSNVPSGITPVSGTFAATGQSAVLIPAGGRAFNIWISGTFVATIQLERSFDGSTWYPITAAGTQLCRWTAMASEQWSEDEVPISYRLNCVSYSSGTVTYRISQ